MTEALNPSDFIERWSKSGGSEQANSQLFLAELCDVLGVSRPEPATPENEANTYSFERKVFIPRGDGTQENKRLDLYRKGCFVLESKQGKDKSVPLPLPGMTFSSAVKRGSHQWEEAMLKAKRQAENYVRCLPAREGRPPFIIVCDVGFCFDLYAEFSCTGGNYLHFPNARSYRIRLKDLEKQEYRDILRTIWTDPLSLNPALRAARVTEEVAGHLAQLAVRLESEGFDSDRVSTFLMRCLFTMFAEDVGLLPSQSFMNILEEGLLEPEPFEATVKDLWEAMNEGKASVYLRKRLKRFNGNIFKDPEVLPLDREGIGILLEAARADWKEVEPAIFGTLLERALNPRERHKLGAHYTPRAYVERLVIPTVIAPLRAEWENVQAAASLQAAREDLKGARKTLSDFHRKLCLTRVLDPACGSGNFLYVTMAHMKRLEGEVINEFTSYGGSFKLEGEQITIDPHQFLGLETNPRAAHIAEMVLWIGYPQWHYQTHGNVSPPEPIIKRFKNIQHKDAILDWSSIEGAVDKNGVSLTRWDRVTFKKHPATGQDVPDESAQEQDEVYEEPKPAQWPEADFIVGNPPFVGNKVRRFALGSGYVDALTRAYPSLPESCDLVMYWWHKAAELVQKKKVRQFGLITTNSITQVFNRRVTAPFLEKKDGCHLLFAIPDHPWVDAKDGAAVRIAMTAGACGEGEGTLATVIEERETDNRERSVVLSEQRGVIHADLTVGADVSSAKPLKANAGLACRGVIPVGKGFIITHDEATALGLGKIPGLEKHIRPYRNGNDITDKPRGVMAIDLLGLEEDEVRARYPEVYQWLLERVKPERDAKSAQSKDYAIFAKRWWLFGKPRETLRPALRGLTLYIITVYVAKHRFFLFCNKDILPDDGLVAIASNDAYHLGVLSSKIHVCWALAAGGRLGVGNDPRYNKTVCFDPFPFPPATGAQKEKIRALAERLHEHRASRQALHPSLTLTGMYNVLEALREGRELKAQERTINEQGLIGILKEIHDQLDATVAEAYGWPANLGEQDILSRLVALNAERVEEEKEGKIRYLRPDYQNPSAKRLEIALSLGTLTGKTKTSKRRTTSKVAWPSDMPSQVNSVRQALARLGGTATVEEIAVCFKQAKRDRIAEVLTTLANLGLVESSNGETWNTLG